MESIRKLEDTINKLFEPVPRLPIFAQKWLTKNLWWLVLVVVIFAAYGVIVTLLTLAFPSTFVVPSGHGGYATIVAPHGTAWWLVMMITLAFTAAITIICAIAVGPLRVRRRQGWVLLFVAYLVGAASIVVSAVISLNVFSFIFGLLSGAGWLAISGYFLFQVRPYFEKTAKVTGKRVVSK